MAEVKVIDVKKHPCWEKLNQVQRYRMLKFSEGKFEIGIDEPEQVVIETHQQLAVAFYWVAHCLRDNNAAFSLAHDLFRQNLRSLLRHTA